MRIEGTALCIEGTALCSVQTRLASIDSEAPSFPTRKHHHQAKHDVAPTSRAGVAARLVE